MTTNEEILLEYHKHRLALTIAIVELQKLRDSVTIKIEELEQKIEEVGHDRK